MLRINTTAIEVQVGGIRRGVRRTWPEVPTRRRTVQSPRIVTVVASVGKAEGRTLEFGRTGTTTCNTIGSSDEINVVVFGGESPAFGADGAGGVTAGGRGRV